MPDLKIIKLFEENINKNKGKPNNFPGCMNYSIDNQHATIELNKGFKKKEFRRFDSWALAFIAEAENELNIKITHLTFQINKISESHRYDLESFKRRVSFLNINNEDILFEIYLNKNKVELYDKKTLFSRPDYEIIHSEIKDRSDQDKGDLLEKHSRLFYLVKIWEKKLEQMIDWRYSVNIFINQKEKIMVFLENFQQGSSMSKFKKTVASCQPSLLI